MKEYYKVHIVMTAKDMSPKENSYTVFYTEDKQFDSMNEIKSFLRERYNGHKRLKMYQDPDAKHIGWIYCFKNKDWNHNLKPWWQRDWVTINHIQSTPILIGGKHERKKYNDK